MENFVTEKEFQLSLSRWEAIKGVFKSWSDVFKFAFSYDDTGCTEDSELKEIKTRVRETSQQRPVRFR